MTWLFLAGGCSHPNEVSGHLLDARTGLPLAGEVVRAETTEPSEAHLSEPSDANGAFTIRGLDPQKTYHVVPKNDDWLLAEAVNAGTSVTLHAWRAPQSDGIFLLAAAISQLVTNSAIGTLYLDDGQALEHPLVIPGETPRIGPGDAVLFAGEITDGWVFSRLNPAPDVPLRVGKKAVSLAGWWLSGVTLAVPARGAPTVTDDPSNPTFTVVKLGDRTLRYLGDGGLPAGRYMIHPASGSRAILVEFGR